MFPSVQGLWPFSIVSYHPGRGQGNLGDSAHDFHISPYFGASGNFGCFHHFVWWWKRHILGLDFFSSPSYFSFPNNFIFSLWTNTFQALHWSALCQTTRCHHGTLPRLPDLPQPVLLKLSAHPHWGPNCSSTKLHHRRDTGYLFVSQMCLSPIHNKSTLCVFLKSWLLPFWGWYAPVENECSHQSPL